MTKSKETTATKPSAKTKENTNESKAKPATPETELANIEGIETGLTIIVMSEQNLAIHVKSTVEQAVLKQTSLSGVGMPDVEKIISLHTGSTRQLAQARAFIELQGQHVGKLTTSMRNFHLAAILII